MEVVLQLRGTNNATVKDVVDLRKFVRNAVGENQKALQELTLATSRICSAMSVDCDPCDLKCLGELPAMSSKEGEFVASKLSPVYGTEALSESPADIANPHDAFEPAPEPDRFTVTTKTTMLSPLAPEAMPLPEYAIDAIVPTIPFLQNERVGFLDFDEASHCSSVESNPDVDAMQQEVAGSLLREDAEALLRMPWKAESPPKAAQAPEPDIYEEFLRSTRTLGMQLLERLDRLQSIEMEGRRHRATVSATGFRFGDSKDPVSIIWRDL